MVTMNKFRTSMGLLVGLLLGIINGIGFRSMPIGIIEAVCYSVLFIFIFNKHPKQN